jgi:hypothetical protein
MQPGDQLHVEVYAHGGWWQDRNGQTGQAWVLAIVGFA